MALRSLSAMSDSLVLFSSDDEESDSHYESKQYENFTSMLKGVPPPTSITISKFTVEEMLQKYKENQAFFGFGLEYDNEKLSSSKNPVPFLKYLNSSQISENIASVAQKVQERFVQMETMSSCNIWFKATLETCGSAKKRLRMRQGAGLSPGRRLSHLARRRQFFSSANLQRLASTENIRQIDIKKNANQIEGRKKMGRTVESEKLRSSKRALFLSPENGTPTKYGNTVPVDGKIYSSGSDERRKLPLQERSKKVEVLRWLNQQNFEMDFPRKRLREECANHSVERKRKCPRRSLNFGDDDASSNIATSESNISGDKKTSSSGKLSEIHKNKLLWAVSVVLRENNITRNNEHFKSLAAKLFFTCRTNLDEILSANTAEGTSDKILHFARRIIPSVFEEMGVNTKLSCENNVKTEKNTNNDKSQINDELKDELKENINKINVDDQDRSYGPRNEDKFVFKTPKKMRQKKGIAKSCQKAPNSGSKRKKKFMRRWRSLELLIEEAVMSSKTNFKDDEVSEEKNCVPVENVNNSCANETIQCTVLSSEILEYNDVLKIVPNSSSQKSDVIENDGFSVHTGEIPNLPFVDTSVIFSPIPSSVQEESDNVLYPSLCKSQTNIEATEVTDDEKSNSEEMDDSMELLNQEEDLEKGIKSLEVRGIFAEEYLIKYEDEKTNEKEAAPDVDISGCENTVLSSPVENSENVDEKKESCLVSAINNDEESLPRGSEENGETRNEKSLIVTAFSHEIKCNTKEGISVSENKEERSQIDFTTDIEGNNEEWEPLTPECISKVEKGNYKPRKLVVKKSRPNWKVVRNNSEEAENESELKLKMRLSHEWEIVCRNSSCSDIGNNSEYETSSMNCSQMSNATEREINSETELESASRRISIQSKLDEIMDEGITKSVVLSHRYMKLQFDDSDQNLITNLCSREVDQCSQTEQQPLIQAVSAQFSQSDKKMQLDGANNSRYWDESYDKTVGVDTLGHELNVKEETKNSDVKHETDVSVAEEEEDSEHENGKVSSMVKTNNFGTNRGHPMSNNIQQIREKEVVEEIIPSECSDEEIIRRNSPILFMNRRSGEGSSKKGKLVENSSGFPEAGVTEEDCFQPKRSREPERAQYDSESGNSSSSNGPERKKRFLSLENYKARKLEEASNNIKSMDSNEQSESKDFSSDEKSSRSNATKKIYNIRLKRPIGHYENKRREKHKRHTNEKKQKHGSREKERNRNKSDLPGNTESETDDLSSIRQFLDNFCGTDSSNKAESSDGVHAGTQDEQAANISNSNGKDVNIQKIIEALSALSNLVQEQIKIENDKMTSQKESGDNGTKKSNWLDVVSSWCGRNLNSFKLMSNTSSLSIEGLDDGSMAAMKEVLNLSMSQSSDLTKTVSSNGHSMSTDNDLVNAKEPLSIISLKTEHNPVQGSPELASSQQMNLAVNTGCNNPSLVNTSPNFSQNSLISNGVRLSNNDFQAVSLPNYVMHSSSPCMGSLSNDKSFNYAEPFSAFTGIQNPSEVNFKVSGENIGLVDGEQKVSFDNQHNHLKMSAKDPRCKPDSLSSSHRVDSFDRSKGSSQSSDYSALSSSYLSNYGQYPSIQMPNQYSNICISAQKPSFYEPNIYSNYHQNWQMQGDINSWNYHQTSMSNGYQNAAFYPFQMSNVPYYINKY